MTKEELEKEAIKRVDAFTDNFSQDVRSTLYDRLSQEDVKDFLYGLYIDSVEPREKRIVDLEKSCNETQKLLDKQIEATYKLDKENAELKRDRDLAVRYFHEQTFDLEVTKDNLTKAKEIIKNLMVFAEMDDREYEKEYKEAEQFISEVEK